MRAKFTLLMIFSLVSASFIACDVTGEEHFDFSEGESLAIVGPTTVTIPQDTTTTDTTDVTSMKASYYIRAFTIDKTYSWNVDGNVRDSVYRDGEYLDVTFMETGTYSISVDDGEYQGSIEVTADRAPNN